MWVEGEMKSLYPTDFLCDLIVAQSKKRGKKKLCTYHFRYFRSRYHTKVPVNSPRAAQADTKHKDPELRYLMGP